jgi:CBS domain-containing protein
MVRDLMTRDVGALDPNMSLREAIEVLRREGVSGAPVVQNQKLVGVVSATDILEFQATQPGVPAYREEPTGSAAPSHNPRTEPERTRGPRSRT